MSIEMETGIVTCEEGHEICSLKPYDPFNQYSIKIMLTDWKIPEPTDEQLIENIRCTCGAKYIRRGKDLEFHFEYGWR